MNLKIKKRLKMKDIISKFGTKVDNVEFNKQLERINNNVTVFSDVMRQGRVQAASDGTEFQ